MSLLPHPPSSPTSPAEPAVIDTIRTGAKLAPPPYLLSLLCLMAQLVGMIKYCDGDHIVPLDEKNILYKYKQIHLFVHIGQINVRLPAAEYVCTLNLSHCILDVHILEIKRHISPPLCQADPGDSATARHHPSVY